MFKYKIPCSSKENALFRINQNILNDTPCGKSLLGKDLFAAGIHFNNYSNKINGFYIEDDENSKYKGEPIKVCFTGKFVEKANNLFFEVFIYPNIVEVLLFLLLFVVACVYGKSSRFFSFCFGYNIFYKMLL